MHVYDGAAAILVKNGLKIEGSHLGLDGQNMFALPNAHEVFGGIGVSLMFQAAIGFDTNIGPQKFQISAVGADFDI